MDALLEIMLVVVLVLLAGVMWLQFRSWAPAVASWAEDMLTRTGEIQRLQVAANGTAAHTLMRLGFALQRVEAGLERLDRTNTAVINLERRTMNASLTGAETGRLLMGALDEFCPHGPVASWRQLHSRRQVLELQAVWSRSCRQRGIPASLELWRLVVEAAYRRAVEELEPSMGNAEGEIITLQQKIQFWRESDLLDYLEWWRPHIAAL